MIAYFLSWVTELLKKNLFFNYESVCGYMHMSTGAHEGQKRVLDSPGAGGIGSCELSSMGVRH